LVIPAGERITGAHGSSLEGSVTPDDDPRSGRQADEARDLPFAETVLEHPADQLQLLPLVMLGVAVDDQVGHDPCARDKLAAVVRSVRWRVLGPVGPPGAEHDGSRADADAGGASGERGPEPLVGAGVDEQACARHRIASAEEDHVRGVDDGAGLLGRHRAPLALHGEALDLGVVEGALEEAAHAMDERTVRGGVGHRDVRAGTRLTGGAGFGYGPLDQRLERALVGRSREVDGGANASVTAFVRGHRGRG
jgi:hypothetical protein